MKNFNRTKVFQKLKTEIIQLWMKITILDDQIHSNLDDY